MRMMQIKIASIMLVSTLGLSVSNNAFAEELQVAYKTFYSHVRKLDSNDTNALQFAFGFMNIHSKSLCEIQSARISTQKQQIPIQITPEYRFTLPSEKALRLADAIVIMQLKEAANICDISVQLETKPEYLHKSYDRDELQMLYQQYTEFFDSVGGFMSFMMPKVSGLTFQFADKELQHDLNKGMKISNGSLTISADEIDNLNSIELPKAPMRITANTTK